VTKELRLLDSNSRPSGSEGDVALHEPKTSLQEATKISARMESLEALVGWFCTQFTENHRGTTAEVARTSALVSDAELIKFGKTVRSLSGPRIGLTSDPLEGAARRARAEGRRRHPKHSGSGAESVRLL